MIPGVQNRNGNIQTITKGTLHALASFMRGKYGTIAVDEKNVNYMAKDGQKMLPTGLKEALDVPITMEELRLAVGKGGGHKAPGSDGIGQEFLKATWETTKNDILTVLNQMFVEGKISDQQKHSVSVPTQGGQNHETRRLQAHYPDGRRLLTDGSDYSHPLKPLASLPITTESALRRAGNTVFEPVAGVREVIPHAEVTRSLLCILLLEFQEAFDKSSHKYLFTMLKNYGFCEIFINRINRMYENAASSIQINRHMTGPIPHTMFGTPRVSIEHATFRHS